MVSDSYDHLITELYEAGIYNPDTHPRRQLRRLIAYCREYDLEMTVDRQEAYMAFSTKENRYAIFCTPNGFFHICRRTKLWLPAESRVNHEINIRSLTVVPYVARAYCWTATTAGDGKTRLIKVGASVRFKDYYEREPGTNKPNHRWKTEPEKLLLQTAEILAARSALGDLVARHRTMEDIPKAGYDREIEDKIALS